jgi:hypothetical protein
VLSGQPNRLPHEPLLSLERRFSGPRPVTSHPAAIAIPFAVIAGLTWTIRGIRSGELSPILLDVRFGDQALQVALLRVLPIRRIPYRDIAEASPTTRRQLIFRHATGKTRVTGLINRSSPLVVIRRSGTSRVFAYTPANRDAFLKELGARIARARAAHRSRARVSGDGVAA